MTKPLVSQMPLEKLPDECGSNACPDAPMLGSAASRIGFALRAEEVIMRLRYMIAQLPQAPNGTQAVHCQVCHRLVH